MSRNNAKRVPDNPECLRQAGDSITAISVKARVLFRTRRDAAFAMVGAVAQDAEADKSLS
jgi:hypothetical protein